METLTENPTLTGLAELLGLPAEALGENLQALARHEHAYLRDLKVNLSNALRYANLTEKERLLLALATAVNEKHGQLKAAFRQLAEQAGATQEEVLETAACVSLMNTNNVFYRFRHFVPKDYYQQTPAGIKMGIMLKPVLGKEFFELMSLAVSVLNGCEMCVNAHEVSVLQHGGSQARIYDAVRLVAQVKGLTVLN